MQAASTNWMKNLPRLSGLSPNKVVFQKNMNLKCILLYLDQPEPKTYSDQGAKACENPSPSEQPCSGCRASRRPFQPHSFHRISAKVDFSYCAPCLFIPQISNSEPKLILHPHQIFQCILVWVGVVHKSDFVHSQSQTSM